MSSKSKINELASCVSKSLLDTLARHVNVPGISVALIVDNHTVGVAGGLADVELNEAMSTDHFMECASLSKTVAAAFAIEYFASKNIPLSSSVNDILSLSGSPWRISLPPNSTLSVSSPSRVTLSMLMNHTALGMHYVFGVPLSHQPHFPTTLELVTGDPNAVQFKYAPLYLEREPGTSFSYSGGGFIVLQHILEHMDEQNRPIDKIFEEFLESCGMYDYTFKHVNREHTQYAHGYIKRDQPVQSHDGGRLSFPALAAGGLCTPVALGKFLSHLSRAYSRPCGSGGISHETAKAMIDDENCLDLGALEFMKAKIGLGVFVANAGNHNKVLLHQAANDGFRGLYMMCVEGPDAGSGFIVLVNGDNDAVYTQCEVARGILSLLAWEGVDCSVWGPNIRLGNGAESTGFNMAGLKQEQIVNLGLKGLVMNAFNDKCDTVFTSATRSRL